MVIPVLLLVAIIGCTIKIEPIPAPKKKKRYYKSSHTSVRHADSRIKKPVQTGTLVTPEWIRNYKELEQKHGGYEISQDQEIKPEGDKFRVPQEVITHHEDMLRTPLPTPSP